MADLRYPDRRLEHRAPACDPVAGLQHGRSSTASSPTTTGCWSPSTSWASRRSSPSSHRSVPSRAMRRRRRS